ncbi:MAG: YlxR family protein [Clostridia bacterium]
MEKEKRMCVVCKTMKQKTELVRLCKKDSEIVVQPKTDKYGKGVYFCKTEQCFLNLEKSKALNRAFKCAISPEQIKKLGEQIDKT